MSATLWVSPYLSDGIGNRLFQVAAAMGAAEQYGRKLVFYLPVSNKAAHSSPEFVWRLFPSVPIIEDNSATWTELTESHFATFEPFPPAPDPQKNLVVRGFRQSQKYFPKLSDISVNFVSCLGSEEVNRLDSLFRTLGHPSERIAFLHVRLGDYRYLPHHFVNLEQYWINAFRSISSSVDKIIILSDETAHVEQVLLPFFEQFKPCKVFHEQNPVSCLYLMSLCGGGAICANSSFSWWGAYLSLARRRGAPIYMPSKWGDFELRDLYPEWATVLDTI
jgi:hypothetical protein